MRIYTADSTLKRASSPTNRETGKNSRPVLCAAATFWGLLVYLAIVSPITPLSLVPGQFASLVLALGFLPALVCALLWAERRWRHVLTPARLTNLAVTFSSVLFCCLSLDTAYTAFLNINATPSESPESGVIDERAFDPFISDRETWLRVYYPTARNFYLNKPDIEFDGPVYGGWFEHRMLASRELTASVLERSHVSYRIDGYGFRSRHDPAQARIFALGDSFCFGQHVDEDKDWVELVSGKLNEPVYNLGVSGTSPWQQYLTLEYLLNSYPAFRPKTLLWMIYEGNDLEDSYDQYRPQAPKGGVRRALAGTLLEMLSELPERIRDESVIHRLSSGSLSVRAVIRSSHPEHYQLDNIKLNAPLFYSAKFGRRFFAPVFIDRLSRPESYVTQHPHRPMLEETFRRMERLSRQYGFTVTVFVAPTDVQLYHGYFDDFPKLAPKPYFIELVSGLGRRSGFGVVNLLEPMKQYAAGQLLYFRDDIHWNERGNAVAAELIAAHLQASRTN